MHRGSTRLGSLLWVPNGVLIGARRTTSDQIAMVGSRLAARSWCSPADAARRSTSMHGASPAAGSLGGVTGIGPGPLHQQAGLGVAPRPPSTRRRSSSRSRRPERRRFISSTSGAGSSGRPRRTEASGSAPGPTASVAMGSSRRTRQPASLARRLYLARLELKGRWSARRASWWWTELHASRGPPQRDPPPADVVGGTACRLAALCHRAAPLVGGSGPSWATWSPDPLQNNPVSLAAGRSTPAGNGPGWSGRGVHRLPGHA